MQALHWDGQRLQVNTSYPMPPVADQATTLVRVRLAGICSTDLQIFKGYMGFVGVPGHEFVGEVSEGPAHLIGQRVVAEINFACGTCETCLQGLGRHCANRRVMGILNANGSFAEYLAVPTPNLHLVPDAVSDEEAVFTEPLAAAFEILEQVHVQPATEVVILGDGKLGQLCAQVLHLAGARVTVVGKHQDKLAMLDKLGLYTVLLADWQLRKADLVVEATGSTAGLSLSLEAVRPRGTLVLKSTVAMPHSLSLAPLVINEVTVVGSRCGRFPPALQALKQRSVSVLPLIEQVYPLAEGLAAVERAAQPGARKVLLKVVGAKHLPIE
ncbi:MAG: alcohol dehydrogenase catalytic domain-containing protein [Deltaproteobacteria bacterium]|nr:alcohol dehydrogenase catalytic domain-containing protein [Deltaproteobacteria bacterium]